MADSRAPHVSQLSTELPGVKHYITGHNDEGKAIVTSERHAQWKAFDDKTMAFNQVYTTNFPAQLADQADINAHDDLMKAGTLGLVKKSGVVCRMVDFAPEYECMMHRTQSIDFGIVLEGSVEMILDDGSRTTMHRGDVAVQRATMHAWRNPSKTAWTRMCFILQDIQPLTINGTKMGEDLGRGTEGLPSSGNDDA